MQFQCSKCKQLIRADEQHYGKVIGCPKCGTNLKVPDAPSVTSQKQPADPLIGKQIAHYKIESLLGQGGMGKVYRAHNLRLQKACAVKVLPPEFARQDESRIARFVREARSAAQIDHPNVLPVQFVGNVGEHYFIEMNYVDGGTLDDVLAKRGKLDANAAARIIREAAMGLQAAHEQGIVHRDIKPSNVMLTKRGRVLVADFGLAKMGETSSALTMDGKVVGTPLYISPEQADGAQADPRSDIYSLGVMFYQMLTGNPPYTAESPLAILMQHKEAPIPDVMQLAPETPKPIAELVRRMMAKKPDERPRSGYAVAKELSEFLGVTPPPPPGEVSIGALPKASEAERAVRARGKKKSLVPVLIGLIPTIIVVAVALYIIQGRGGPQRPPAIETVVKKTYKYQGGEYTAEQLRAIGIDPETGKRIDETGEAEVRSQESEARIEDTKGKTHGTEESLRRAAETAETKESAPATLTAEPAPGTEVKVAQAKPEAKPTEGAVTPLPKPKVESQEPDLVAYYTEIKPVNDLIDEMKYSDAGLRANLLKSKYPDLIDRKLKNLEAVRSLRERCIERINSGAAKVSMGDISRRYAFAGPIESADDSGLRAAIKKGWDSLEKDEVANFYRKASDPTSPEDAIGIAAFLIEGNSPDFDAAMVVLGQAAKHGADVSPYLNYIETLKKSQTEYAAAEERGKALETAAVERTGGDLPPPETAVPKVEGPEPKAASYDDVYVTTAATGEKIPHPLSRKTYRIIYQGKRIDVPEGMVFVPEGPFIMGDDDDPAASPAHKVDLKAFFVDKYEVTNAQYWEFVEATGHPMPKHWVDNVGKIPEGRESHPVTWVDWEDAKAYCDWCGKRLPTEAEWEKAASWDPKDNRKREYPWGDSKEDPRRPMANWCIRWGWKPGDDPEKWWDSFLASEEGKEQIALGSATMGVGTFHGGLSPYGCCDMAGNVWEWVQDWFDRYSGNTAMPASLQPNCGEKMRVLRGGCWRDVWRQLRCASRKYYLPQNSYHYFGFRCAADYPWKPPEVRAPAAAPPPETAIPKAESPEPQAASYDDVYVTTAATGEKIPHPLSRKTYRIIYQGKRIDVPEGMVFVPAGPFLMGEGTEPPDGPQHEVYLDAYFIGKYEVTNAEWKAFVDATGFTPPQYWAGGKIPEGKENHPVGYVSWDDAKAYCDWCGKRLPTEAEWEKAASWDPKKREKRTYPWGNEWDMTLCNNVCMLTQFGFRPPERGVSWDNNFREWLKTQKAKELTSSGGHTMPVGSFRKVKSFYGCYDTAGNVWEWCADWFKRDYYLLPDAKKNPQGPGEEEADVLDYSYLKGKGRTYRSGAWCNPSMNCAAHYRHPYAPTSRSMNMGFRLAQTFSQ